MPPCDSPTVKLNRAPRRLLEANDQISLLARHYDDATQGSTPTTVGGTVVASAQRNGTVRGSNLVPISKSRYNLAALISFHDTRPPRQCPSLSHPYLRTSSSAPGALRQPIPLLEDTTRRQAAQLWREEARHDHLPDRVLPQGVTDVTDVTGVTGVT